MKPSHWILLLLLVVAIAVLGLVSVVREGSSAEDWASRIENSLATQNFNEAIRLGELGLEEHPRSAELRWFSSNAHFRIGDFELALAMLTPALDEPGADQQRILFAAGELVGGLFYENYPGGSGLMAATVFGKLAGESAAALVAAG